MGLSFTEGNGSVAFGAVTAGCRFFAGFLITPATTIFNTMLRKALTGASRYSPV